MGNSARREYVSQAPESKRGADVRFASAILLRPFQVNKNKKGKSEEPPKSQYEQQVELKQRMKSMLENEQLIPRVRGALAWSITVFRNRSRSTADKQELIFLTRCQRMMQANNQLLGSPSSRVNLTAKVGQ